MKYNLRSLIWRGCVAFLLSDLMIALTYVLMDNFCPCFYSTVKEKEFSVTNVNSCEYVGNVCRPIVISNSSKG